VKRGGRGWILLDVVAALAVALAGIAAAAATLATLARVAAREAADVRAIVEERNADATGR
jgi:hypothetical protein